MPVSEVLNLKLTPSKQKAVARFVTEAIRSVRQSRSQMDGNLAACWERFEILPPSRALPFVNASNLRTGLTYWTIRSVWVRIMRTVFGQEPTIRVTDESRLGGPDASLAQLALSHLTDVDLALRSNESQWVLNGLVEGTGVAKLLRDTQERTIRDREQVPGQRLDEFGVLQDDPLAPLQDVLMERTVTDRVGLGLSVIDLKDFVLANAAIFDVNKQPWLAHRVWLRWDDIVRRQRDGIFEITRSQLAKLKPLSRTRRKGEGLPLDQVKSDIDRADDQGSYDIQEYPLWEWQGKYDSDNDGLENECWFTVHEDYPELTLRAQGSPWWNGQRNYFLCRPIPRSNRAYGISLAMLMQGLQDEADTRLNQDLSATTLAILAGVTPILDRTMKAEWDNHKFDLGKPIFVDVPAQFRSLSDAMKYNPLLGETDLNRVFALAERTSGVTDPFLGKTAKGETTAYEIATVTTEGNVTFAEMVEQVQGTNRELGFQTLEHAYQLSQESESFRQRLIRVCGADPFEGTTLAELRQRFDLQPTGNTVVANREVETRKWTALWMMLKDEPLVNADLTRRQKLLSRTLRVAIPEENPEDYIGTEQDAAQQQQKAEEAQRTAQALAAVKMGLDVGQSLDSAGNGRGQPTGKPGRIAGL